ncbi:MAG: hypothetical protein RIR00_1639 [Pseudomonadota bacterium]|jgi:putative glutamine amidotransferase
MTMRRLGLTLRVVSAVGYDEPRDAISHDWITWLATQDIEPVLLSNAAADPVAHARAANLDGLILSSGNDVVRRTDGGDYSALRNRAEGALLDWAMAAGLPVLGVCRGLHMINAHCGGRVRADIREDLPGVASHVACQHRIQLLPAFAEGLGITSTETNSYHRQGLAVADLAPALAAFALSDDGIVEGLVHRQLPVLAVQWHPERPGSCSRLDHTLFRRLLDQSAFWKEWFK